MMKQLAAYVATLSMLIALDALWLGIVAKAKYQSQVGHLLAPASGMIAARLFYTLFALGLMLFAVAPHDNASGWRNNMTSAALFGFFTYMTYDLTNLATLRGWPVGLSILDISWGVVVSAGAAASGRMAMICVAR